MVYSCSASWCSDSPVPVVCPKLKSFRLSRRGRRSFEALPDRRVNKGFRANLVSKVFRGSVERKANLVNKDSRELRENPAYRGFRVRKVSVEMQGLLASEDHRVMWENRENPVNPERKAIQAHRVRRVNPANRDLKVIKANPSRLGL